MQVIYYFVRGTDLPVKLLITALCREGDDFKFLYLGVNIKQLNDKPFKLSQPFLVKRITTLIGIDNGRIREKLTPVGKPLLEEKNGVPQKYQWN